MSTIESKSFGKYVEYASDLDFIYLQLPCHEQDYVMTPEQIRELAANLIAAAEYAEAAQRGDMTRAQAEDEAERIWGPTGSVHDREIDASVPLSKRSEYYAKFVKERYWVGSSGDGMVQPHVYGNGNTRAEAFVNAKSNPHYKEPKTK